LILKSFRILQIFFLLSLPNLTFGQTFYRFTADFSIKEKLIDGTYRLTMGKVYYDKIYKKIVYKLSFPKKETIVIQDTLIYTIDNTNKVIAKVKTVLIPDFTIFHLSLTGKLSDYGLKPKEGEKAIYKISKIEKKDMGIVSTWSPTEEQFKKVFGEIKMMNVDKKLDAMVFYNPKGIIISQQYFKQYAQFKGVSFPAEVTMMSTDDKGKKNLQLTTYKNIQIDQSNENEMYRYKIPISTLTSTKAK
jgi:hypothetical protein